MYTNKSSRDIIHTSGLVWASGVYTRLRTRAHESTHRPALLVPGWVTTRDFLATKSSPHLGSRISNQLLTTYD